MNLSREQEEVVKREAETQGPPSLTVAPYSLEDVGLFVIHHPRLLSNEAQARLEARFESQLAAIGRRIPVLVLEGGTSLEVVREGGWVYAYEQPDPPPGLYEVAVEYPDNGAKHVYISTRQAGLWVHEDGSLALTTPYAYRPAPVPPPVRRVVTPSPPQDATPDNRSGITRENIPELVESVHRCLERALAEDRPVRMISWNDICEDRSGAFVRRWLSGRSLIRIEVGGPDAARPESLKG